MMLVRGRRRSGLSSAGFGVGLGDKDPGRPLRGTVRVPSGRRDGHSCLQRDAGVLAAHRSAVDEPAAIWLALSDGYRCPAGLKVSREATAIAGWPDHDTSVARCRAAETAATRGVRPATRTNQPPEG